MLTNFIIFILSFNIILIYLIYYLRIKLTHNNKHLKIILFKSRRKRIHSFNNISDNILTDILEAIKDYSGTYEQVHAILPLLSDIKKHGEKLIAQRKFYHSLFFSDSEKKLTNKIHRLHKAEIYVKSLARRENESYKHNLTSF